MSLRDDIKEIIYHENDVDKICSLIVERIGKIYRDAEQMTDDGGKRVNEYIVLHLHSLCQELQDKEG